MPLAATIQSRIARNEFDVFAPEGSSLLGVEIEDTVTVDGVVGKDVVRGVQWRLGGLKGRHGRGRRRHLDGAELVERPKGEGVIHPRPRSIDLPRLHDSPGYPHVIDEPFAA